MADPEVQARIAALRAKKEALLAARAGGAPGGAGASDGPGGSPLDDMPRDPLASRRVQLRASSEVKDERLPATYVDTDEDGVTRERTGPVGEGSDGSGIQGKGVAALGGFDKSTTFGLGGKLADVLEPGSSEAMASAAAENPGSAAAGSIAGAFAPLGAAGLVGKAAGNMAGIKAGQSLAQNMGRGMLAGAGGGATMAAGQAAVAGEDPVEAGEQGFKWGAMLGPLGGALGWGGQKAQRSLRDPRELIGRDLNSAKTVGTEPEFSLRGVKPGAAYEEATAAATEAGGVHSQTAVTAEKGAPVLAEAVGANQARTLGSIKMQNEAGYASPAKASLQPLLESQLKELHKATFEGGQMLPGKTVGGVVKALKETADVKVVSRTSDIAHQAEPQNIKPLGWAKHVGLVRGGPSSSDDEMVVVFTPHSATAEQTDEIVRGFSDSAKEQAALHSVATQPTKGMAAAAREARGAFGPEWQAAKAAQSQALGKMKNANQAAGLPRDMEKVDFGKFGTKEALHSAMLRYRSGDASLPMDKELDALAATSPALREALDNQAGISATQRLLGQAEVPLNAGGVGSYGLKNAAKLRADPMMRYLGVHGNVLTPGMAAAGANAQGRRQ